MHNKGKPVPPRQALDAVVIGEAHIGIVTTPEGTKGHPGVSPANVLTALPGWESTQGCSPPLGADGCGAAVEDHLTGAGVVLLPGSRSPQKTSTATGTIAPDGSAAYGFVITWDVELSAMAPTPPQVPYTGSIASFLSPGAGTVKGILQQFRDRRFSSPMWSNSANAGAFTGPCRPFAAGSGQSAVASAERGAEHQRPRH